VLLDRAICVRTLPDIWIGIVGDSCSCLDGGGRERGWGRGVAREGVREGAREVTREVVREGEREGGSEREGA